MAGSIGPVERGRRGAFAAAAGAHLAGAAAGAIALGGLLAALAVAAGAPLDGRGRSAAAAAVLALAGLQMFSGRLPIGPRRQVPARWIETLGPGRALAAYGGVLGVGATTRTSSYLLWALPAVALALGPAAGAAAGACFAVARAAAAVALASRVGGDPAAGCRMLGRSRAARLLSTASLAALAIPLAL